MEIERQFLDGSRNPALDSEGIAGFRLKYDKLGNRSEAVALAADGQPTYHKDGFAGWVRTYDRYGNVTDETYVDAEGKPIIVSAGYAKWHGEYDDRGFRVAEEYRGSDDKPVLQRAAMPGPLSSSTSAAIRSKANAWASTASRRSIGGLCKMDRQI